MFREKATNGKKLRVFPRGAPPPRPRTGSPPVCARPVPRSRMGSPRGRGLWACPTVVLGPPHGGWEKQEDGQALGGRVLLARLFIIASQALAVRTGRPPSQGVRGWDPRPACGQRPVESGESSDGSHGRGAVT